MSLLIMLLLLTPLEEVRSSVAVMSLTPEMRSWAHDVVDEASSPSARFHQLRSALRRRGLESVTGVETPTAAEAFEAQRTDCVGYALLLVALAREVAVPAHFVLYERFPAGGAGERRADPRVVDGHLAVAFADDVRERAWDAQGALDSGVAVPDVVALAVFYSNRGVGRLLQGDAESARRWLRRAVALTPDWDLVRRHLALAERR